MKTTKTLSILLVLLFILQLIPIGTALAAEDGDKDTVTDSLVTVLPEDENTEAILGEETDSDEGEEDLVVSFGEEAADAELNAPLTPRDVGILGYVKVHDTFGGPAFPDDWNSTPMPPIPLATEVSVKKMVNGSLIPVSPENIGGILTYKDITANSTIDVNIGFHMEYPEGELFLIGDYFDIPIPSGLKFASGGSSGLVSDFARWDIVGADQANIRVTITDNSNLIDDVWGRLAFSGTFKYMDEAGSGSEDTSIQFGGQTINIKRVPGSEDPIPPKKSQLNKSYSYDPVNNEIIWTINITPPTEEADPTNYDYSGFKLLDTISGNHIYKSGSFTVNGTSLIEPNPSLSITTGNKGFSYTFPAGHTPKGAQTITYKTTPALDAGAGATNTFANTAELWKGPFCASNRPTSSFQMGGFFSKVGGDVIVDTTDPENPKRYVHWKVTLKLPIADPSFSFPNAKIVDTLPTTGSVQHKFINNVTANSGTPNERLMQVRIKKPGDSVALPVSNAPGKNAFEISGTDNNILTYSFPDGQPTTSTSVQIWELTYYTEITDWKADDKSNSDIKVTNSAKFVWDWNPGLGSGGPWGIGTVDISKTVIPQGGLISKIPSSNTDFDHNAAIPSIHGDYIKWTVVINSRNTEMSGITLKDVLQDQDDHELVISSAHPLTVKKNNETELSYSTIGANGHTNGTLDSFSPTGFTFTLPSSVSKDSYTFSFYTKITDTGLEKMYINGSKTFKNDAILNGHGYSSIKVTGQKTYTLQMLNKSSVSYDYSTRTVTWRLLINRNRLPMTSAVITDKLPSGLVLSPNDEAAFKVEKINGTAQADKSLAAADITFSSATDGFTLTLPTSGAHAGNSNMYEITYTTHIEDSALLNQGLKTFKNWSYFDVNGKAQISNDADRTVQNPVIEKKHNYNSSNTSQDVITWTVDVNPAQVALNDAKIKDLLHPGLKLLPESIKLYYANVAYNNPSLIRGSLVTAFPADTISLITEDGKDGFELTLPTGAKAYQLVFETAIIDNISNLQNTITLSGGSQGPTGISKTTQINVTEKYSSGGSGSREITLRKIDESGAPISGVEFTLWTAKAEFRRSGALSTRVWGTTDSDGKIKFENLPNWVFFFKEENVPNGYIAITSPVGGIKPSDLTSGSFYDITNVLGEAPVQITKVGAKSEKLNGGVFTLTGKDFSGKSDYNIAQGAAAGTGIVSFGNLPIGDYEIRETSAPDGHTASSDIIYVKVAYTDDNKTAVTATYSNAKSGAYTDSYTLENKPDTTKDYAKLSFKKVDADGNAIPGVVFVLKGNDYADNPVRETATSQADGSVTFAGLTINKTGQPYKIFETPPADYLYPNANPLEDGTPILTATVDYNTDKTALVVSVKEGLNTETYYDASAKTFKNVLALADVKFSKKSSASDTVKINGGIFVIEGTSLGGQAVSITSSAIDSVVTFKNVPVGNNYTIKELIPPPGYLLTTETLDNVKVGYTSDKTGVIDVDLTTDSFKTLKNDPAPYLPDSATIFILKTDEDGVKLPGASFALYDKNGKAIATAVSDDQGLARFTGIPAGNYTIRETTAPKGYILSNQVISLTLEKGDSHLFTFVNTKDDGHNAGESTGSISLLKANADGDRLAGAEFSLYGADGTLIKKAITGTDGIVRFTKLPYGNYTVRETVAPTGYKLFYDALPIEISAANPDRSFTLRNAREDKPEIGGWEDEGSIAGGWEYDDNYIEKLPQTGGVPKSLFLLLAGLVLLCTGIFTLKGKKGQRKHKTPGNKE